MRKKGQRSGAGSQPSSPRLRRSGVRSRTFDVQTSKPSTACRCAGFTLVELMLATVISIMVFAAVGILLTRSFSLWMDGAARWRLAQHARVTRARLLDGGFNGSASGSAFTGWLSSSGVTFGNSSGEAYVDYCPIRSSGVFRAYGWTNAAAGKNIRLQGGSVWALGQTVAATNYASSVQVDMFRPYMTNGGVTATYRLRLDSMGRTFEQPCTVRAFIIN